jgi:hypothetical protein
MQAGSYHTQASACKVLRPFDLLEAFRARSWARAYLFAINKIDLHHAVDILQDAAVEFGLVKKVGQDAMQTIIAEAFGPFRQDLDAKEETPIEPEPDQKPTERAYRTPQSTIDAFFYVLRLDDAERLTAWLAQHPRDVSELYELWERKCSTRAR